MQQNCLFVLINGSRDNQALIAEISSSGTETAIHAIASFQGNARIRLLGLRLIFTLLDDLDTNSVPVHQFVHDLHGIRLIVETMNRFQNNHDIINYCIVMIHNLHLYGFNQEIFDEKVVAALMNFFYIMDSPVGSRSRKLVHVLTAPAPT